MTGILLVLALLAGGALISTGDAQASPAEKLLFIHDVEPAIAGAPAEVALEGMVASRSRPVTLNPQFAVEDGFATGDTIVLDLFADRHYTATVDRVTVNVNGTISVRARIEGYPFGYLLVSTTEGRSLGSIVVPEKQEHYIIMSPTQWDHFLLEIVEFAPIEKHPPLIPPPPTREETEEIEQLQRRVAEEGLGPDDPAEIDVMIVYTPAAREAAEMWRGGIANVIAEAMERAQLTLENSDTGVTMALVYTAEVDYIESGSSATDLDRLTSRTSGYMDEVHDWRDQYGADLVALFTYPYYGGRAWQLGLRGGRPAYGFSVTGVMVASVAYTHIHELGHNMGCHHHKEQPSHPGPTYWLDWPENRWSAGWSWMDSDETHYASVMTYAEWWVNGMLTHVPVAHFSNPAVSSQGQPTGHPEDGDNARTIREMKHVIAAYRASGVELADEFQVRRETGDVMTPGAFYGSATHVGGADLAEWVAVSEPVEPGHVLEIDPTTANTYRLARGPCSPSVAGVVSTTPGIVLGSRFEVLGEGHAQLALLGVVPVKVTDEGGPIAIGDLLTVSSTPGHAMRWDPLQENMCAFVGKALEDHTEGVGVVSVLLTW